MTQHYQAIPIGYGIRQGDIYVISINETGKTTIGNTVVDVEDYTVPNTNGKLVPMGTSKGASHKVNPSSTLLVFNNRYANRNLVGPIIQAKESFYITHDEHAHFLMPGGTYQVMYQMDAATLRAVAD
jgi:hypothetical protein